MRTSLHACVLNYIEARNLDVAVNCPLWHIVVLIDLGRGQFYADERLHKDYSREAKHSHSRAPRQQTWPVRTRASVRACKGASIRRRVNEG